MHELGYDVTKKKRKRKKERDVYQCHKISPDILMTNGDTQFKQLTNRKLYPPTSTVHHRILLRKLFLFHDETTFQDQPTVWAQKGTNVIRPKSKGSGIMVSDFICE